MLEQLGLTVSVKLCVAADCAELTYTSSKERPVLLNVLRPENYPISS